jgi:hypothetical protein
VPAGEVSPAALFRAAPWRTFRWYFGQRHYSGTYWSATERDHVIYESRLELANLILGDFEPTVHHIVAQPFQLTANVDGQERRHILDYLWDSDEGPIVVVLPPQKGRRPARRVKFAADRTGYRATVSGVFDRFSGHPMTFQQVALGKSEVPALRA